MTALPVTVVIPVRNEAPNMARCLECLKSFDEIVVIDSGSEDATCDIARQMGAKVVEFKWNGSFPKKRNWYLMNHKPQHPWVLFLDADEYVDDAFCKELARATADDSVAGYWLNYTNYFLGRKLSHGLKQRKLALFRHGAGLYEKIAEDAWSRLDMEVHEHPIIEGKVGEISAPIDHRDYKGLDHFIMRHKDYALWEARRFALLRDDAAAWSSLTQRQRFKYTNLTRAWYPAFYFLFTYVAKFGCLDGAAGFHYAAYKAWYFRTIRLLIAEYAAQAPAREGS